MFGLHSTISVSGIWCKYTPNCRVIKRHLTKGGLQSRGSNCFTASVGWKLAAFFCATACFAQQYEVGVTVGYGAYRNGSVTAPGGTATAGFGNTFVAGAIAGDDRYPHIAGELRYLYQDGDPFVSMGSAKGSIRGQSHAVHYDLIFHLKNREARLRPYAAVGAGV